MDAATWFAARLAFETDPSDVAHARRSGAGPVVLDVRDDASWAQGHVPGAVHVPGRLLAERAAEVLPDRAAPVVVHCWGPGCNGATKAALTLARLGYTDVKEMIGGFEYWAREGLAVEGPDGRTRLPVDPLTAPVPAPARA